MADRQSSFGKTWRRGAAAALIVAISLADRAELVSDCHGKMFAAATTLANRSTTVAVPICTAVGISPTPAGMAAACLLSRCLVLTNWAQTLAFWAANRRRLGLVQQPEGGDPMSSENAGVSVRCERFRPNGEAFNN
jgi:hypothetical protein